jgi:hypothetical protein
MQREQSASEDEFDCSGFTSTLNNLIDFQPSFLDIPMSISGFLCRGKFDYDC